MNFLIDPRNLILRRMLLSFWAIRRRCVPRTAVPFRGGFHPFVAVFVKFPHSPLIRLVLV